jgi:hypothetical protein
MIVPELADDHAPNAKVGTRWIMYAFAIPIPKMAITICAAHAVTYKCKRDPKAKMMTPDQCSLFYQSGMVAGEPPCKPLSH